MSEQKAKIWFFTLDTEMHFDEPVSEKECVQALMDELSKTKIEFNGAHSNIDKTHNYEKTY